MRKVSTAVRADILADWRSGKCMRAVLLKDHECGGRITWEHVFVFAGRQVDARWSIIQICARAHGVDEYQDRGIMSKEINEWISLNLATDAELAAVSKAVDYLHRRKYLNSLYGIPKWPKKPVDST